MGYQFNLDNEQPPKRLLDQGWRHFKIMNAHEEVSKAGNEMIVFSIQDVDSGYYDKVFALTQPGKRWVLKNLLEACGVKRGEDGNYNFDFSDLLHKEILGLVSHEPDEYVNRTGETVKTTRHRLVEFKEMAWDEDK